MKAGLEVHQQLATAKLHCDCPSELSEEVRGSFGRRLRAAGGEGGRVDRAAAFEVERARSYRYEIVPTSCLVDADEEPPHPLNAEALDVALTMALLLEARPLDEVEVMRKIVVDGSNTAGFQRTALVAVNGRLRVKGKIYSILSICLEEDAARRSSETASEVVYRLDRLGIPLVEIATGPEITDGTEAHDVAEEIGALLRSTRRVRRGIGTIREDLNVSIEGGQRVEIKGVQELRLIDRYAANEVDRQRTLLAVRDELVQRAAPAPPFAPQDVTGFFSTIGSGALAETVRKGGCVLAMLLPGFAGLLRSPPGTEERLGRELADYARTTGLKGLIHSDELPGYGLDAGAVERLRDEIGAKSRDGFILVADKDAERPMRALERVAARADLARRGIPEETRDPLPDGRSRYSRPLPGRHRMYPETDVPPVPITAERLARIRSLLPERPGVLRARLEAQYDLPAEVVRQLEGLGEVDRFETLVARGHPATTVARLLTQDLPGLGSESDRFEPSAEAIDEVLRAQQRGAFSKEGIPLVLAELAGGARTVEEAVQRVGFATLSREELVGIVDRVIEKNHALVRQRGADAFSALMGDVMREVRGRRDGQEIATALREALARAVGPCPT